MYKKLRIVCSIICALIVAGAIFVFVYLDPLWTILTIAAGFLFFGLTLHFKRLQEKEELKDNPPTPVGDFITGKINKDED